jgi:hypothetical protein
MNEPDVGSRALLSEKLQSNSADPEATISPEQDGNEPVDARGLPVIEAKEPSYKYVIGVTIALQAIGAAIATAIYTFGSTEAHTSNHESKIQMLAAVDLHWVYASAGLLSFTVRWVNFYPSVHKSMIMTRKGSEGDLPIPSQERTRRSQHALSTHHTAQHRSIGFDPDFVPTIFAGELTLSLFLSRVLSHRAKLAQQSLHIQGSRDGCHAQRDRLR